MAKKRSSTNIDALPPHADDLKRINGIGPGVEKRLNNVSIFTFAQLATLSPADVAAAVADLTGLTAERINKQDWIGQARKLASEAGQETEAEVEVKAETEGAIEEDAEPSVSPKQSDRLATFTIEVFLDDQGNVGTSRALHVESESKQSWPGWQQERLVDFLITMAGINIAAGEPASSLESPESDEGISLLPADAESEPLLNEAKPDLTGVLLARGIQIVAAGSSVPRKSLVSGDLFDVQLALDLTELKVTGCDSLHYTASVYGKDLSRSGFVIGESQGSIGLADTVTITVKGNPLPVGTYHIAARLIVGLPDAEPKPLPGRIAVVDGGLIQVY